MYPNPYESPDLNLPPKGFASKVYAYLSGPWQLIPFGVTTKVQLNAELFDLLAEFSVAVGTYNFVPTRAGYYLITAQVYWEILAAVGDAWIRLYVNGADVGSAADFIHTGDPQMCRITQIRYLTPNDTLDVRVLQNTGVARNIIAGSQFTYLCIHRLS